MASTNKDEHKDTYAKVFVPMVKWGTPIFAILMLLVIFFTTR